MSEMTIEEIEKKLQKKFEELERPIYEGDFLEGELSHSQLLNASPENLIFIYFYEIPTYLEEISLYYPKNEKKEFFKNILLLEANKKEIITFQDFFSLLNEKFIEFFNLKSFFPEFADGKNYWLDLFTGSHVDLIPLFNEYSNIYLEYSGVIQIGPFDDDVDTIILPEGEMLLSKNIKRIESTIKEAQNKTFNSFIEVIRKDYSNLIQFNTSDKFVFIITKSNRKNRLLKIVTEELLLKSSQITILSLVFNLGLKELPLELPKPITKKELRELAKENDLFVYNEEEDSVRILTDEEMIAKIKKHFTSNTVNFKIFDNKINKTGILALFFIGDKIPFDEMKEYINVRPILYINGLSSAKTKEEIFLLNKELTKDEDNDIKYLKSLFNNDEEYLNWLENNTAISFYEADEIIVKHIYSKLIGDLSPIFNITHNPGNLFQYTLKSKLESRLSGNILKVGEKKEELDGGE